MPRVGGLIIAVALYCRGRSVESGAALRRDAENEVPMRFDPKQRVTSVLFAVRSAVWIMCYANLWDTIYTGDLSIVHNFL